MERFAHYMYVLACGDGSYYTGYTTDVDARVAAHAAGRGARYTRAHGPVRLLASARFYSKARAMRAEALFKRLSREAKEALLAAAAAEPLECVLERSLPGFGGEDAVEFVCRRLSQEVDPSYRAFMAPLIPTVDAGRLAGVRTPVVRAIAKEAACRDDAPTFLRALPHRLFEENQVHAFMLGRMSDYDAALPLYERFLPHVDNWATCDQLPVRVLAADPSRTLERVSWWLASGRCYTIRFGIGVLMRLFLDERFEPRFLQMVADARMPEAPVRPEAESDAYYVDMMRAWYFAEALAKQREAALPYLEARGEAALLDEWTRRRAIQKAVESRRIAPDLKDHLRTCR